MKTQYEHFIGDLLRNPTREKAIAYYEKLRTANKWPYPVDATIEVVAMAVVHKARLAWPRSTKAMIRESNVWLVEHGMKPTLGGVAHHGTVQ